MDSTSSTAGGQGIIPQTTPNHIWVSYQANAKARGKKTLSTDVQRYRDHIQSHLGAMVANDIRPVYIQNIVDECLTTKSTHKPQP